jgi:hypothetical protein
MNIYSFLPLVQLFNFWNLPHAFVATRVYEAYHIQKFDNRVPLQSLKIVGKARVALRQ